MTLWCAMLQNFGFEASLFAIIGLQTSLSSVKSEQKISVNMISTLHNLKDLKKKCSITRP